MDRKDFDRNYWKYYLILEERFIQILKYIEPVEENMKTYSLELVDLLLSVGSEIDVMFKEMSGPLKKKEKRNIGTYSKKILNQYPEIGEYEIVFYNHPYKPFEKWNTDKAAKSPFWWKNYNSVKHGRVKNFKLANLKTVTYALMALYLLEILHLKKITNGKRILDRPYQESEIFFIPKVHFEYTRLGSLVLKINREEKENLYEEDKLVISSCANIK